MAFSRGKRQIGVRRTSTYIITVRQCRCKERLNGREQRHLVKNARISFRQQHIKVFEVLREVASLRSILRYRNRLLSVVTILCRGRIADGIQVLQIGPMRIIFSRDAGDEKLVGVLSRNGVETVTPEVWTTGKIVTALIKSAVAPGI